MNISKKYLISFLLIASMILAGCGSSEPNKSGSYESGSKPGTSASSQAGTSQETKPQIPENYAYSIRVTINPDVELFFDAKDVIVGVDYLNKDAETAYKDLEIVGKKMDEGMPLIIDSAVDKGFLKKDGKVSIELASVKDKETVKDSSLLTEVQTVVKKEATTKLDTEVSTELSVNDTVSKDTGIQLTSLESTCTQCNGKGVYCSECNGTTIVKCKRCNNGVESCGTCNGTAIITCHGCHGQNSAGCSYCGGSGKMSCDACGGKGTFQCSWCKGALEHICPDCEGNPAKCSACNGTGKTA